MRTSQEFLHAGWAAAASGGRAPIDLGASAYQQLADVRAHALERGQGWWSLSPFVPDPDAETGEHLNLVDIPSWHGDVQAFTAQIKQDVADGWRVFRIGDFLEYRIIADAPGRLDLEVQESLLNPANDEITSRTRRLIVTWTPAGPDGAPEAISATPAR